MIPFSLGAIMNKILLLSLSLISLPAFATTLEFETSRLVCVFYSENGFQREGNSSCVSKASIAKDTLEKEVLALQKEKLLIEVEELKNKQAKKKK